LRASETVEKSRIYYPREYRHFLRIQGATIPFLLLCVAPVVLALLVFYPQITEWITGWSGSIIGRVTGIEPGVESGEFLRWTGGGDIRYLSFPGSLPSWLHAIISAGVSVIIFIVAALTPKIRPLMIYLCMAMFVQYISSMFFILVPEYFPYTLTDYSELYMKQQVSIWLMVTLLIGISVAFAAAPGLSRVVVFYFCVIYTFMFGCVRYVLYILVLHYFSLLYMATLFFTLGVLFDFLQMVAIYAVFVRYQSSRINTGERQSLWQWS
jgi:hypothetical protein